MLRNLFLGRRVALSCVFALLLLAAPAASFQAGVAAAVRGAVQLDRSPQVGLSVKSGDPIHMGDVIRTDHQGGLQILLLDETVFTLGPDSEMTIDEFVYDPNVPGGQVDATLAKGVFRFVTGKVARDAPENMNLQLPEGSIGIRGTIAAVRVGDTESVVALLGPGPFNDADERVGGLDVRTPGGTEELVTPGFGVRLVGTGPPSAPFHVDAANLGFLPALPTGRPPSLPQGVRPISGPEHPSRAAGAVRVSGQEASVAPARVALRSGAIEDLDPSPLQGSDGAGLAELIQTKAPLAYPPGLTSVQQLVQFSDVFQGRYVWKETGALLKPPNLGAFDADVVLDFGRRDISFKFHNFNSTTFLTSGASPGFVTVLPWGNGAGGDAKFVLSGSYFEISSSCPCNVSLTADFLNKNNLPAQEGIFVVKIDDGGTFATTPIYQGPPTLVLP